MASGVVTKPTAIVSKNTRGSKRKKYYKFSHLGKTLDVSFFIMLAVSSTLSKLCDFAAFTVVPLAFLVTMCQDGTHRLQGDAANSTC
jgi:hypothetical protein